VRTTVETFALEDANEALARLRSGKMHGAAALVPGRKRSAALLATPKPSEGG